MFQLVAKPVIEDAAGPYACAACRLVFAEEDFGLAADLASMA